MKRLVKRIFNVCGFDLIRTRNNPQKNLLGLKAFTFGTIIDIGANEGQFAKSISHIFRHAHIFCFEPLPEPFKKLEEWAISQHGRVEAFNVGLGQTIGSVKMHLHTEHNASSSLLQTTELTSNLYPQTRDQREILVELTTLDEFFGHRDFDSHGDVLLKMDVQGFEDRVIRGGQKTLSQVKAIILEISLNELYVEQASFKGLYALLDDIGFQYKGNISQIYDDQGRVVFLDALFMK